MAAGPPGGTACRACTPEGPLFCLLCELGRGEGRSPAPAGGLDHARRRRGRRSAGQ